MKKIIAITIVALTVIAVVLTGCAGKEPVEPSAVTALATTSANERYPVWSLDGSKMAFVTGKVSEHKLDRDIYVIDVPDS